MVKLLFHQFKISSHSFLRVLATLFILATAECIIYKQRRSGAAAADSLSVHEYTSHIASAIWQARASLRCIFAESSSSLCKLVLCKALPHIFFLPLLAQWPRSFPVDANMG